MSSRTRLRSGYAEIPAAHPATARRFAARWAMALAALFSLAFQCLVVQTHVHEPAATVQAGADASVASPRISHRGVPPPAPLDCPACRQLAQSGAYLTPGPIAFVPPPGTFARLLPLPLRHSGRAQRSHRWQSRGPPADGRASRLSPSAGAASDRRT